MTCLFTRALSCFFLSLCLSLILSQRIGKTDLVFNCLQNFPSTTQLAIQSPAKKAQIEELCVGANDLSQKVYMKARLCARLQTKGLTGESHFTLAYIEG